MFQRDRILIQQVFLSLAEFGRYFGIVQLGTLALAGLFDGFRSRAASGFYRQCFLVELYIELGRFTAQWKRTGSAGLLAPLASSTARLIAFALTLSVSFALSLTLSFSLSLSLSFSLSFCFSMAFTFVLLKSHLNPYL